MDQNRLLWSDNDFTDFKHLPNAQKSRRSNSTSSTNSTFDSEYRDLVYANHYFQDTSQRSGSSEATSLVGGGSVVESDDPDIVIIDADSEVTSPASLATTPTPSRKGKQLTAELRKRQRKELSTSKRKKQKKSAEDEDGAGGVHMEMDSDCEIIEVDEKDGIGQPHPPTLRVTSTRQANIQARLPDKMDEEDRWFLVEKDLIGRERYEQLYDFKRYNLKHLKCPNCKQRGHNRADCPQAKRHTICYLCGTHDHVSSRCPSSICQYCFQPSHRGRPCKSAFANPREHCRRCYVRGHIEKVCPENWKQFHNTTHASTHFYKLNPGNCRSEERPYCSNCSKNGHYNYECNENRPRGCPFPFMPVIARYDDHMFRTLQKKGNRKHHLIEDREKEESSKNERRRKKGSGSHRYDEPITTYSLQKSDREETPSSSGHYNRTSTPHLRLDKTERHFNRRQPSYPQSESCMPPGRSYTEPHMSHGGDVFSHSSNAGFPRRSHTDPTQNLSSTPRLEGSHLMTSPPLYHDLSLPAPPPRRRLSIHERLEPLPNDIPSPILPSPPPPPLPRQIRSLSFEHTRIPEDLFTPPQLPPRWEEPDYPPRPPPPPLIPNPHQFTPDSAPYSSPPKRRYSYTEGERFPRTPHVPYQANNKRHRQSYGNNNNSKRKMSDQGHRRH